MVSKLSSSQKYISSPMAKQSIFSKMFSLNTVKNCTPSIIAMVLAILSIGMSFSAAYDNKTKEYDWNMIISVILSNVFFVILINFLCALGKNGWAWAILIIFVLLPILFMLAIIIGFVAIANKW